MGLKENKWTYLGKLSANHLIPNYTSYSEIRFTAVTSKFAGQTSEFNKTDLVSAGVTYVQNINSQANCTIRLSDGMISGSDGIFWGR